MDADADTPDIDAPANDEPFRFYASRADGTIPNGAFASVNDIYVNARGSGGAMPGNYSLFVQYEICHPQFFDTYFPQLSPMPCMTFHVGANGQIDAGPTGECAHAVATDPAGGLMMSAMPFELTSYMCEPTTFFVIRVVPEGNNPRDPANPVLFVPAEMPHVVKCGDGIIDPPEQCDDLNLVSGDGCSFDCLFEPVCGNGMVEAAEECDDGNTTSGDDCSATCMHELPLCDHAHHADDGCATDCRMPT